MAARRHSSPSDGSVFLGILGLLFLVGLVIQYIWWFVAGAALVGVGLGAWALMRRVEAQRRLEAEQQESLEFEMARHAERQRRWTLIGDERAIYGQGGATERRRVARDGSAGDTADPGDSAVAALATTPAQVDALVREKPSAWPQALFASILVQRLTPLLPRLRDAELGFMRPGLSGFTLSPGHLASEVTSMVDEMMATERQVHAFMCAPAFMAAFAHVDDSGPDPETVKHIANRTMDFCERFLELSERCRALSVRSEHVDIVTDCAHILYGPLASYREFVGDFADLIHALPKVLEHANGTVDMGSLGLYLSVDDKRYTRVLQRLDAIRAG